MKGGNDPNRRGGTRKGGKNTLYLKGNRVQKYVGVVKKTKKLLCETQQRQLCNSKHPEQLKGAAAIHSQSHDLKSNAQGAVV